MKSASTICITAAAMIFTLSAIPLCAQDGSSRRTKHHHYKFIDLGTLGGTDSNVPIVFDEINGSAGAQAISERGIVAGTADTSDGDPLCYFDDCFYPNAFQWQDGKLTTLSPLSGGGYSSANWVSRDGLIAGISENGQNDPLTALPIVHGVLWQDAQVIDVGTLAGGYESFAWGVNNHGQVVGFSTNGTLDPYSYFYAQILGFAGGTQSRAFLWDKQNGMQDLGTLGGPDAWAAIVNEQGQVAGISYTSATANADNGPSCPPGVPSQDPFFWDKNSGMIDVGNFGGTCAVPQAFNNRGQMAGQSYLAGNTVAHAFLWSKNAQPQLKDLGSLGGDNAAALWIDDAGDVVGYADIVNPGGCSGLTCVHHAVLWRRGTATDLGSIGTDPCSRAISINSAGQVVGLTAAVCGGAATHGFLWEDDGPAHDLNSLVSGADMALTTPSDINDRGEIAGVGLPPSCSNIDTCGHAFLLIPCDENHPGVEGCDYNMVEESAAGAGENARPAPAMQQHPKTMFPSVRPMLRRRMPPRLRMSQSTDGEAENTTDANPSSRSSCASANVTTEVADDLIDKLGIAHEVSGESGRGLYLPGDCSVNRKTDTLTGYCEGSIPWAHTCGGGPDAAHCPAGQKAKEPGWGCGDPGVNRVDFARRCQFVLR